MELTGDRSVAFVPPTDLPGLVRLTGHWVDRTPALFSRRGRALTLSP